MSEVQGSMPISARSPVARSVAYHDPAAYGSSGGCSFASYSMTVSAGEGEMSLMATSTGTLPTVTPVLMTCPPETAIVDGSTYTAL